jgi:peroxin-13
MDGGRPWFGVPGGLPASYMFNNYPYNYAAGYGGISLGSSYEQSSPESNFLRLAEESSRGAFRSIESLVSAVTSISNMLISTHNAVFSSFRAVIGVVDQFRSLKYQVMEVILATLLRWIVYLWRRILIALRMKPKNYAHSDALWESIHAGQPAQHSKPLLPLNWPTVLFWLMALGGPYVIYRCVSQLVKSAEDAQQSWMKGRGEHYVARALYEFRASSQQELSMREGDQLRVAPKSQQPKGLRDWLLAWCVSGDARHSGFNSRSIKRFFQFNRW